ncbi:hypothetical protein ACERII_16170 [Evansella sp. AB-rgal1]|uniref:hypothetical protein n=1 Tax=Evansella sp. AB-rgal1 TaxID=3242696 RepID=UPI00359E1CC5
MMNSNYLVLKAEAEYRQNEVEKIYREANAMKQSLSTSGVLSKLPLLNLKRKQKHQVCCQL